MLYAGCGAWIGWCACSIPQPVSCSARPVPLDSSLSAEVPAEVRRVLRLRQYPWLPPPSYPGIYSFEAARYGAAAFELCMELEARGIPDLPAAAVGALPDPAAPLPAPAEVVGAPGRALEPAATVLLGSLGKNLKSRPPSL